ncbi:MAG: 1,4-alpha-glucan branching protein GlgB [Propionibacteriaceae bacterium]|jgi:1,4-alpha-glucan branching enzyme|nr:1,4-alpha-glucan branching protein GlgB [Propionibacteriaceae bacterium]
MNERLGNLTGRDLEGFHNGGDTEVWKRLGSHVLTLDTDNRSALSGTRFAVWAPNARQVRLLSDFNWWTGDDMELIPGSGVWGLWVESVGEGTLYKYQIQRADGSWVEKADPMARACQTPPDNASIVTESHYVWSDAAWLARRATGDLYRQQMSIYELHLGSWRPGKSYRELALELPQYVRWMGYTHVELMPVAAHPLPASWGYQVTGYFSPDPRLGGEDDLRALIDALHNAGVGVILDWVPGHFPKDDWALGRFDGTALYEHADPRKGEHMDWGTYIFNYGRNEVKSFLVSNAWYWVDEFHVDGLRVDAVASMLYLDYSRTAGEWLPNIYGGRENLEAIDFLRYNNRHLYERAPGVTVIAEESTAFGGVSKPIDWGGLGFGFKWNMGWMNDSLRYLALDPIYRSYHHNEMTFAMVYAYSENFILPISHDEVVHGKGSMINKIPGDDWQKFATLRAFYAFQWAFPGKQLQFMGQEWGQRAEWNEGNALEWWVDGMWGHRGLRELIRTMNRVQAATAALYDVDHDANGFAWINANDGSANCFSWRRIAADDSQVAVIVNFSPVPRPGYGLQVPVPGVWDVLLNTDDAAFDGADVFSTTRSYQTTSDPTGNHWLVVDVPPLAALWLKPCVTAA